VIVVVSLSQVTDEENGHKSKVMVRLGWVGFWRVLMMVWCYGDGKEERKNEIKIK
jgi:hypothetical protein